nr:transglycosylase SLT domain-containing protein [Pseudaminobacter soli]
MSKPPDDFARPPPAACLATLATSGDYRGAAKCEARRQGLPPEVALAVMEIESNFDPGAKGAAGEVGLMQIMPATARMLGFAGDDALLADPAVNIRLGLQYLAKAHRLADGDLCTTLMKYRAGHSQTRFSARSVEYCKRARKILSSAGYRVTGGIPTLAPASADPSPKAPARAGPDGTDRNCVSRSFESGPRFRHCITFGKITVTRLKVTPAEQ